MNPQHAEALRAPYTLAEIEAKIASHDYNAELLLQHAMLHLREKPAASAEAHWYCVAVDGQATLCTGPEDARDTAAEADQCYPRIAPHRAVQLVPAESAEAEPYLWGLAAEGKRPYLGVADSRKDAETMAEFENARYDEPRYRVVPLYAAPRPSPEQAALLAEIEGLRKKATRYDWLRDNWGYISDEYDDGGPVMSRIFLVGKDDGWDTDPESIHAANDAAIVRAAASIGAHSNGKGGE